jgi:HK97 family phage portal protein
MAFGLGPRQEARAIQATPWGVWPGDSGTPTWSGANVTTDTATQLLSVRGCNQFIGDGISTLPVDSFRKVGKASEEVAPPPWLSEPTVELNRVSWLTQILTSLLLDGNCYLRKGYDGTTLRWLDPLAPSAVVPFREKGRKWYRVGGQPVDPFEILHIPGAMRPGALAGMSPVEAARQEIGLGMAATEFAGRFYSNGANLGGVITYPGELPPEKAREIARTFARRHSGNRKAHLPAVLEGGGEWKTTGVTPEQMQFLASRQFTSAQIAAFMFLIDPTEFGVSMDKGSSITYANLEQRNFRKLTVTFLPWIVRIEMALSSLIAAPRFIKFNVNGLLRADLAARYASYAVGIENGFLGADEARAFEDLPPRDDLKPAPPAAPAAE